MQYAVDKVVLLYYEHPVDVGKQLLVENIRAR